MIRGFLEIIGNPKLIVDFEKLVDRGRGGENNPFGCKGKPEKAINPDDVRVDSDPVSIPIRDRSREPQAGNSEAYGVRRLNRERPDLLSRVKDGALSVHRAMVEAGFRKPTITIPLDPEAVGRVKDLAAVAAELVALEGPPAEPKGRQDV